MKGFFDDDWGDEEQPRSLKGVTINKRLADAYRKKPEAERTESEVAYLELADKVQCAATAAERDARSQWATFNPGFPYPGDQK